MTIEYRITFFQSASSGPPPNDSISIWPTDPNWNDFSYGFRAKARIGIPSAIETLGSATTEPPEVSLYVVPWPLGEHLRFDRWLREYSDGQPSLDGTTVQDRFFTILANVKSYQALLKLCGRDPNQMAALFGPLRDMTYLRWRSEGGEPLGELLRSEAVGKGVFRNDGPYRAWHQARSLFGQDDAGLIDDARKQFRFSSQLPGFTEQHVLLASFGAEPPLIDRVHALIGRNGVGKSQLLRELVVETGLRTDHGRQSPFSAHEKLLGIGAELDTEGPLANRVIVMSWDINHDFPRESRLDSAFQYFCFSMNEPRVTADNSDPIPLQASETQTAMLLQLLRDDDNENLLYERLKRVLKPAFRVERLAVFVSDEHGSIEGRWKSLASLMVGNEGQRLSQLQRINVNLSPLRIDDEGREVPLSSGERSFLNFGIRCTARLTAGSLLILDEPETHMHPNLVADFMRILAALVTETKSIALIATHSPFVVRELPGRCVHVLRMDDERRPRIQHAYLRTLGASVDRLAIDIFGDAEAPQLNHELATSIAKAHPNIESVRQVFGQDVSFEMLSEIRELLESTDQDEDTDQEGEMDNA